MKWSWELTNLVFDWFTFFFSFSHRDYLHKQYRQGEKHNLREQVAGTSPFNSNQFAFMGQDVETND